MEKLWQDFCVRWGLGDKEKRRVPLLIGALAVGLLLMGVSQGIGGRESSVYSENAPPVEVAAEPSEEAELEERLSAVLSRIKGAGEVEVSLTFAASGEVEYAVNASTTLRVTEEEGDASNRSTTEETRTDNLVLTDGNSVPLAVKSKSAEVQGVLVVAEGGDNPAVCRAISEALQNLLDVGAHKIVICTAEQG